jgi:hypothetical protein
VEDPTEHTAMEAMQEGNKRLEEGDVQGARDQYAKSVEIKPTASACFNLGVGALPSSFRCRLDLGGDES